MGGKKSGGGFLGVGGQSGLLNTGIFSSGPQKIKGFEMSAQAKQFENQALQRQAMIASGQQPGYAQLAMNQNIDQANRQGLAMAASQRGSSNPALAFRQAQISNQQNTLEGAQQAAIMSQQERQAADNAIFAQANAQRGIASQQAQANLSATMSNQANQLGAISGLGQAAVGASSGKAASDENAKEDIKPAKNTMKELESFVSSLKPSEYKYKDSKHGTGEKIGVMAQDLEKTKVGKTLVDQAPDGTKMVDTNKSIGVIMATLAEMSKKIKSMEK